MIRILIADDDPDFRFFFKEAVMSLGYACESARDGDEAIKMLRKQAFDIIFLDVLMPRRGAISTLHAIRRIHSDTPIVIISGNEVVFDSPIIREGLQLAQAKMSKTGGLRDLAEVISDLTSAKPEIPRPLTD
ncbi:response regulator [Amaricoccus macauensis]|uniref:response regulator n=1 Tax=Amaricoccus macauensis TaxID=57001 RepID=UPI003C7B349D